MKALAGLPENSLHSFPPKTNTSSSIAPCAGKPVFHFCQYRNCLNGETVTVTSGILSGMPIDISCTCYKNRYE